MRTVRVSFDSRGSRFVASGSQRGEEISINAPKAPGEQRGPTGFSATELLLAAAGACSAWDVLEIIRKSRQELTYLEVSVEGRQAEQAPWAYEQVTLHFRLEGSGLRRSALERVIRLSCVRYCSVLATLKGVARIEASLELVGPNADSQGRQPVRLAIEPAEPLEAHAGTAREPAGEESGALNVKQSTGDEAG